METGVVRIEIASAAIFRQGQDDIEILVQERSDGKGCDLPGGLVEEGEDPRETAVRETREECGLEVRVYGRIGEPLMRRRGEEGEELVISRVYLVHVRGGALALSDEAAGFLWVSLATLDRVPVLGKNRPEVAYPNGCMYEMMRRALTFPGPTLSEVSDPDGLAKIV